MNRGSSGFAALALAALAALPAVGAEASAPTPVVDLHVDLSYRVNYRGGSLSEGSGQVRARHLVRAGVSGLVLPLFVPHAVSPEGPRASDLEQSFATLAALIPKTPPLSLPGCAAKDGAVRTWLSFEGSAPLADDPDAVTRWVSRGARLFGLVHTKDNALAGSSAGTAGYGLTERGRELARRIYAAGGVVDVSHASDAATEDVLRLAAELRVPVVATHSNARALVDHPRNLTDDQIRRIAASGGVVGVNFHSRFLVAKGRARLDDVVSHVRHLVRVAGADHVAIGSDFEGDILPPVGLEDVRGFPKLAAALGASGLSPEVVTKIFSGNAIALLCPAVASNPTR